MEYEGHVTPEFGKQLITVEQFKQLYPRCREPEEWVSEINTTLPHWDIDTPERVAAFISQCGHESAGWSVFSENLNYSAQGLLTVFRRHFDQQSAEMYARKPEKIANRVYANRMGNGDELSGDGWKYRGRGPIQLTGKDNYTRFAKDMLSTDWKSVVNDPDKAFSDKYVSLLAAVWFWNKNGLNSFADIEDHSGLTRRINGGYNGLDDRIKKYKEAISLLRV